jgi:hypothetical protein
MKRLLLRCALCVGPAPPDLPAVIETRALPPMVMTRVHPDMLPRDFKLAAAGEREPGEDG